MTRFFVFAAVVALVIALPVTHEAFAGGNNTKVKICHVNSSNSPGVIEWVDLYGHYGTAYYDYGYTRTFHLGRVIEVDASAVDAHVAHGDSASYSDLTDSYADYLESLEDNYTYWYEYGTPWVSSTWWVYGYKPVNAVVKNADCYWIVYQYNY